MYDDDLGFDLLENEDFAMDEDFQNMSPAEDVLGTEE